MTGEKKPSRTFAEQLHAEHHELRELLGDVKQAMDSGQQAAWPPAAAEGLAELLSTLHGRLQEHFAMEEKGGYLQEALDRAPRLVHKAAGLEKQHPVLLEMFGRLIDRVGACRDGRSPWSQLHEDVSQATKELLTHEGSENQLVQDAFNVDVGSAD